jgi:hypothetical protein
LEVKHTVPETDEEDTGEDVVVVPAISFPKNLFKVVEEFVKEFTKREDKEEEPATKKQKRIHAIKLMTAIFVN